MNNDNAIMTSGLQDFRTSGLQDFRTSGLQDFRTSGLQDFRTSGRDSVADALRGFAIILVVIGHVLGGFQNSKLLFPGVFALNDFIYSFHMPLFFMIAGYVHGMKDHFSAGQTFSGYLKKYVIDLYLPCIYFSLSYWLLKYFLISPSNNAEGVTLTSTLELCLIPLKGFQEYWFLCTLFFVKVIHAAFEGLCRRANINALFWCVIFAAAKFCGADFLDSMARLSYGLYFHIGFLMRRNNLIRPRAIYGVLLFVAGFMFFLLPYVKGSADIFTGTAAALFMSTGLMIMFYAFWIENRFLAYCGIVSMVIYALHNYIIAFMRFAFRLMGLSSAVNPAVLFIVCCFAALFVPLLVIKLYQNVECLSWIEYIFYPSKILTRTNTR